MEMQESVKNFLNLVTYLVVYMSYCEQLVEVHGMFKLDPIGNADAKKINNFYSNLNWKKVYQQRYWMNMVYTTYFFLGVRRLAGAAITREAGRQHHLMCLHFLIWQRYKLCRLGRSLYYA